MTHRVEEPPKAPGVVEDFYLYCVSHMGEWCRFVHPDGRDEFAHRYAESMRRRLKERFARLSVTCQTVDSDTKLRAVYARYDAPTVTHADTGTYER